MSQEQKATIYLSPAEVELLREIHFERMVSQRLGNIRNKLINAINQNPKIFVDEVSTYDKMGSGSFKTQKGTDAWPPGEDPFNNPQGEQHCGRHKIEYNPPLDKQTGCNREPEISKINPWLDIVTIAIARALFGNNYIKLQFSMIRAHLVLSNINEEKIYNWIEEGK